jgi:hypothetical protein
MAEEENPFLLKKKPAHENREEENKPHYEKSGTPIWDKKGVNLDNPDYEVVEHKESEKDKKKE